MRRFNLLAAEPEYDDTRPRGLPRGDGPLRAEDRRGATGRLGLRAPAGAEHLPLPLRVSGGGVADAARRHGGGRATPEGEEELGRSRSWPSRPARRARTRCTNRGSETVRVLMLSTKPEVSVCVLSRQRQGARGCRPRTGTCRGGRPGSTTTTGRCERGAARVRHRGRPRDRDGHADVRRARARRRGLVHARPHGAGAGAVAAPARLPGGVHRRRRGRRRSRSTAPRVARAAGRRWSCRRAPRTGSRTRAR